MHSPTRKQLVGLLLFTLLAASTAATPIQAQKKGNPFSPREVIELRAEIERLRTQLEEAQRDIRDLKGLQAGKLPARADDGPLYRGRPLRYWLEQFKDLDHGTALEAAAPIARFARNDKKLVPMLLDALKNEKDHDLADRAAVAVSAIGPSVLPALVEIAKDKSAAEPRRMAIYAIGRMGRHAKPAVPTLMAVLRRQTDVRTLDTTISALRSIGPSAKEAIPDLVDALGDSLTDIGKPDSPNLRFGTQGSSINNMALDTLFTIDPLLRNEIARPRTGMSDFGGGGFGKGGGGKVGKKGGFGGQPRTPEETLAELRASWENVHVALVKKYAKPK